MEDDLETWLCGGDAAFCQINLVTCALLCWWWSALGCPDVEKPRYGWLVRERAGVALIGCNESRRVRRLTCDDNRWVGPAVNCSPPGAATSQSYIADFAPPPSLRAQLITCSCWSLSLSKIWW